MNRSACLNLLLVISLGLAGCASPPVAQAPELVSHAQRLQAQGVSRFSEDNFEAALLQFRRALDEYRLIDDAAGTLDSSINIARTYLAMQDFALAREWTQTATRLIDEYQPAGASRYRQNTALLNANIAYQADNTDAAVSLLDSLVDSPHSPVQLNSLKLRARIAFDLAQDRQAWFERYRRALLQSPQASPLHRAYLLRLDARLQTGQAESDRRFGEALAIYRELAHKRGIAAGLYDWSVSDMAYGSLDSAEQKLLRALYIRARLQDQRNLLNVFRHYRQIADAGELSVRPERLQYWIEGLEQPGFDLWNSVLAEFSTYPD